MPKYKFEADGKKYTITSSEKLSPEELQAAVTAKLGGAMVPSNAPKEAPRPAAAAPKAASAPDLSNVQTASPEEAYSETGVFSVPEQAKYEAGAGTKAVNSAAQKALQVGGGIAQGAVVDPLRSIAQLLPGQGASDFAKSTEDSYQDFRKGMGGEGFDAARLGGNVISPFAIKGGFAVAKALPNSGRFAQGAAGAPLVRVLPL